MRKIENKKLSVSYFAFANRKDLPGVVNKIEQTILAFSKKGNESTYKLFESKPKLQNIFGMLEALYKAKSKFLIIRCTLWLPWLLPVLILKRILGYQIIIDVPTPNTVALQELRLGKKSRTFRITFEQFKTCLFFPISLWVASKIIQYAPESKYFSIGLQRKTKILTNGINVSSIHVRKSIPVWPDSKFVMIGVASLAGWHAYDRIISGIAVYVSLKPEQAPNPRLIIIGDGPIRKSWESHAASLGVSEHIEFTGFRSGNDLDELFETAHVAVSSLGLYRINLQFASVLKSREYTARGIPFIAAGLDKDFEPSPNFRKQIANDDSHVNISEIIDWYSTISSDQKMTLRIRQYAEDNLDFSKKIDQIIS